MKKVVKKLRENINKLRLAWTMAQDKLVGKFFSLFSKKGGVKKVVLITDCTDVASNEMKLIILLECQKLGIPM